MPGFLTEHTNNMVLDCLFGGIKISPPDTLYVGLSLGVANKRGHILEPEETSYRRAAITNDLAGFLAAYNGAKSNVSAITFPEPLAAWGSVLSVFIVDADEGGNVLAMADLPTPKTVDAGDPAPTIQPGSLHVGHN